MYEGRLLVWRSGPLRAVGVLAPDVTVQTRETNFGAIWLRSGYLLLDHNFLSDIQGPGVTFITGGDYQRSNLPIGYWGIVSNSIFVGDTQKDPFTIDKIKKPMQSCLAPMTGMSA